MLAILQKILDLVGRWFFLPSPGTIRQGYYPFLDGLRCFSVLWVVLHHFSTMYQLHSRLSFEGSDNFYRFVAMGPLGVDVFFVISGFLITGLLLDGRLGAVSVLRFYARRAFKILPQYYLVLITAFVACYLKNYYFDQVPWWGYFLFLQNFLTDHGVVAHLWSIAVEEHYYLVYPLLIVLVAFFVKEPELRRKVLFFLIVLLMAAVAIGRYYYFRKVGFINMFNVQLTPVRMDALLMGCLIRIAEPWLVNRLMAGLRCWALFFMAASVWFFLVLFRQWHVSVFWIYIPAYLAAGGLILAALGGLRPLVAILEFPLFRWIGKWSYAIYLWHYLFFIFVPSSATLLLWVVFAGMAGSVAAGAVSTVTIERYFLRMRDRLVP